VFDTVRDLGRVPMTWQGLIDLGILPSEPTPSPTPSAASTTGNSSTSSDTVQDDNPHTPPSIVEPWKCWGGLAGRAAHTATHNGHPVVSAACWYLDYTSEFEDFFNNDPITVAVANAEVPAVPFSMRASATGAERTYPSLRGEITPLQASGNSPRFDIAKSRYSRLLTDAERKIVLGGEGAMWTEHVDFTNLECRVWPRAAAMAMHMWGFRPVSDSSTQQGSYGPYSSGRGIVLSYIIYRSYLWKIGVKASEITLHETVKGPMGAMLQPKDFKSFIDMVRYVGSTNTSLSKEGFVRFPVKIVSQCKGFESDVQRPITGALKVAQLNTADGAADSRRKYLLQWLRQQANFGVDLVGFCEANGWHVLDSTSPFKVIDNFPLIRGLAASVGYTYSHVTHSPLHPYNIGVMSSHPFTIMGEYGPPKYERGLLHIYIEELKLHAFIAHLNAHSSEDRVFETQHMVSLIKPILERAEHVIVMGDMNSLYRADKHLHDAEGLLQMFHRTDNPVFPRLLKKLATTDGAAINYAPLDNLVEVGLVEVCSRYCSGSAVDGTTLPELTRVAANASAACMESRCSATEPTSYNPEVSRLTICYIDAYYTMLLLSANFVD
jgi:endonuclease/exonuclease/phosphatase family metal-dependent hydrolase